MDAVVICKAEALELLVVKHPESVSQALSYVFRYVHVAESEEATEDGGSQETECRPN